LWFLSNHPIDQYSDKDDTNGLLDHQMMDVLALVETTTNDDHPIGALANGDDVDDDVDDSDNNGDRTTDGTSKAINEDIPIVGQKQKRANIYRTRDVKFGGRIIKDVPNNSMVIGENRLVKLEADQLHWKNILQSISSNRCMWSTDGRTDGTLLPRQWLQCQKRASRPLPKASHQFPRLF
jgi:hypothetical protein